MTIMTNQAHPSGPSISRARVLVFTRRWSLDREHPAALAAIRDRLAGLGAELIVLCDAGVWSFRGDEVAHTDRLVGDVMTAAMLYGARNQGEAVFVLDGATVVRVAPPASDLVASLDAAANLLSVRRVTRATTTVAKLKGFEPWRRERAGGHVSRSR